MALVCDIESNSGKPTEQKMEEVDLEDGEIEDDEEEAPTIPEPPKAENPPSKPSSEKSFDKDRSERSERSKDKDRSERRRHEEKGKKHMTEAEKSILHLRKREMQRKKWEKFSRNKEPLDPLEDDFAQNIEKTLATILSKKEKEAAGIVSGNESTDKDKDKDEERRGRKRRKRDRDTKHKQRRLNSPQQQHPHDSIMDEDSTNNYDDPMTMGGSGGLIISPSHQSDNSEESEYASDRSKGDERRRRRGMTVGGGGGPGPGGRRGANRMGSGGRDHHGGGRNSNKNKDGRKNDGAGGMQQQQQQQQQANSKDSQEVCVFYLQGKCIKNDCPYSHEAVPPMKLELCKFYLMDCCAKGDKCSYMHSEFPCKFYHTGLNCTMGDDCKFAHGKPLSEGLKQILFKHIETAPRDILGGFPRMSREEALDMIDATQNKLRDQQQHQQQHGGNSTNNIGGGGFSDGQDENNKGGIPSLFDISVPIPHELRQGFDDKMKPDKPGGRNRPSRWQDSLSHPGGKEISFPTPTKPFNYGQDQDMRINSNGDIDMRTLPPPVAILPPPLSTAGIIINRKSPSKESSTTATTGPSVSLDNNIDIDRYKREAGLLSTSSTSIIMNNNKDVDIRNHAFPTTPMDIDIRIPPPMSVVSAASQAANNWAKNNDVTKLLNVPTSNTNSSVAKTSVELKIDDNNDGSRKDCPSLPADLPKTQRDLFMRIHAQQKVDDTTTNMEKKSSYEMEDNNINWYSEDDDDDDDRLTIKVDGDDIVKEKEDNPSPNISDSFLSPPMVVMPQEVVDKLGDLSKIDISAEVTKLLTSMTQNRTPITQTNQPAKKEPDPVDILQPVAVPTSVPNDPRVGKSVDPRTQDRSDSASASSPSTRSDPRLTAPELRQRSQGSIEMKQQREKTLSIYEQGSIDRNQDGNADDVDIDIRGSRSDVDLRNLELPFGKGGALLRNYTPATEIDGSISSHPPISWRVAVVDVPRPDYTGLKLSAAEAEKTGDPRLKKIFRLSGSSNSSSSGGGLVEERDTPLSPKASPKSSGGTAAAAAAPRVDPRLRKTDDSKSSSLSSSTTDSLLLNFNQQLNMLQSSVFYQSLTSNQKLLLNQEINLRNDTTSNQPDPVLTHLLSKLNLIPGPNVVHQSNTNFGAALNILSNMAGLTTANTMVSGGPPLVGGGGAQQQHQQLNPNLMGGQNPNLMNQMNMAQPGLLGAAPGIPNIPNDFPMGFDPRNGGGGGGGLLGPPPFGGGYQGQDGGQGGGGGGGNNFNNFSDDFYQPPLDGGGGGNMGGPGPGPGGGHNNFPPPRDNHRGGFNRDRRRGGRNFNNRNNGGNRNFRNNRNNNNRTNRTHSPP